MHVVGIMYPWMDWIALEVQVNTYFDLASPAHLRDTELETGDRGRPYPSLVGTWDVLTGTPMPTVRRAVRYSSRCTRGPSARCNMQDDRGLWTSAAGPGGGSAGTGAGHGAGT